MKKEKRIYNQLMQKESKITNTSLLMKIFNVYTDAYECLSSKYAVKKKGNLRKSQCFKESTFFNVYTRRTFSYIIK